MQSHAFALRIRPAVAAIAARYGARVAVAEVPPGPPVLQALVAEVYGPDAATRQRLAGAVRTLFVSTPGVVDVDWYVESPHPKELVVVDKEKAALHGIQAETVARTLRVALGGESVGQLHVPREQERSTSWSTCRAASDRAIADTACRCASPRWTRRPWCRSASSCASEHRRGHQHLPQESPAGGLRDR